jgi:hypothetical protein
MLDEGSRELEEDCKDWKMVEGSWKAIILIGEQLQRSGEKSV